MPTTTKIKGIILKISDTPGKDKLLHILTDSAYITAFMTPKRSAGKKSYTVDIFTYGEFVLYVTDKGNNLVNAVTPIEYFYGLRNDISRLSVSGYFAELAKYVSSDADCDYSCLMRLFLKAIRLLSDGVNFKLVKPVFEFKAAQLLGFTPCLEAEKKAGTYYFDLEDGRLYTTAKTGGIMLPRSTVYSIYKILSSDPDSAFSFMPQDDAQADAMYSVAQQYILYHTERDFSSLKFLNGVI